MCALRLMAGLFLVIFSAIAQQVSEHRTVAG